MTVAVACNTPEGVILGTDSTITLNDDEGRPLKTYENAVKLFQLGNKPIGIATFGIGALGNRIIGSYLSEFERQNPKEMVKGNANVADIAEELRQFFLQQYQNTVVPEVERRTSKKFPEVPDIDKPVLGIVVGGFSTGAYLSEVWQILIPHNAASGSASLVTGQGDFRSSWYALCEPIFRYHKGFDNTVLDDLRNYFAQLRGTPLTAEENTAMVDILLKREYQIPVGAMPMREAIAYVRFLVEMVINHYRFVVGSPVVGGKVQIGLATYKGQNFHILSSQEAMFALPDIGVV